MDDGRVALSWDARWSSSAQNLGASLPSNVFYFPVHAGFIVYINGEITLLNPFQ
jgi:hypothetical protein